MPYLFSASQIKRVKACPGSAVLPAVESPDSDYAARGKAIHAFLYACKQDRNKALAAVPEAWRPLCAEIDVSKLPVVLDGEVSFAFSPVKYTAKAVGKDRDYSKALPTDVVGTVDVVGIDGTTVYVGDFKTGHAKQDPAKQHDQLRFLAMSAALTYNCDSAVVEIINIREDGTAWRDTATFSAEELDEIAFEIAELAKRVTTERAAKVVLLAEGDHCRHCNAMPNCTIKAETSKALTSGRFGDQVEIMKPLSRETAGHVYNQIKAAKMLLKRAEEMVYACAKEQGPIPLGDGKFLGEVEVEGNDKINGVIAHGVLCEIYGNMDVANDATEFVVTKKSLGDAVKKHAPKGKAAAETREAVERIRSAGGITNKKSTRIEEFTGERKLTA